MIHNIKMHCEKRSVEEEEIIWLSEVSLMNLSNALQVMFMATVVV